MIDSDHVAREYVSSAQSNNYMNGKTNEEKMSRTEDFDERFPTFTFFLLSFK